MAYYTVTGTPANGAFLSSSAIRAEFVAVQAGFALLPTYTGNGSKIVAVNSAGTALEAITTTGTGNGVRATSPTLVTPVLGVATATSINKVTITAPASGATLTLADGSTLATSGAYSTTFTATGVTTVTLPTTGTLATLAGSESLTNKKLGSLTSNGLVQTSGGDGTLSVLTPGTGVATALAVNVGTDGAFVVKGGALGSPSSAGTLPAFTLGGTVTLNGQSFSGTCADGGTFTTIDINGGTVDGTAIGGSSASTGAFTTISASGAITATGGQIVFPATQVASADANTLDDYEEGTYTVSIAPSASGSITLKSGTDTFSYTKIGRKVTVCGYFDTDSVSSPTGYIQVTLPFAIGNLTESGAGTAGTVVMDSTSSAPPNAFVVIGVEGDGFARIYLGNSGTGLSGTSAAQVLANTNGYFSFTYFV